MAGETEQIWRGEVSATAEGCSPDQVWPLFQDYFNLHEYHPFLDTCYGMEGVSGQPGCVRYCASSHVSNREGVLLWSHEKLLAIDPEAKRLTYEITKSNAGFDSLCATVKLTPVTDRRERGACGLACSFVTKPVPGWTLEELVRVYQGVIESLAEKVASRFRTTG
ncbi:hypothetical protein MLD38_039678 [Melastoma candidum]|uniref:Uncharacterized protein n=1 Tax=Melastoma candidum TaxID=119954 RepID=A0ACB9L401_9MYRT|nr:hypothetical protein MLD38_039678 [Melastoma candidum]